MTDIYVENLNVRTKEETLKKLFKECGKVDSVTIKKTSEGRYAVIIMPNEIEAINAHLRLNGTRVDGNPIQVNTEKPKGGLQKNQNSKRSGQRPSQGGHATTEDADAGNFINPYHFLPVHKVPLEKLEDDSHLQEMFIRQFKKDGSHFQDRFRKDCKSGRIVCEITTESEIFIGAGKVGKDASFCLTQEAVTELQQTTSDEVLKRVAAQEQYYQGEDAFINAVQEQLKTQLNSKQRSELLQYAQQQAPKLKPFELNGEAAIPATSLKGMISAVMEAASNSALRVLDKKTYTRRMEVRGEPLSKIGILRLKIKPEQVELLRRNQAPNETISTLEEKEYLGSSEMNVAIGQKTIGKILEPTILPEQLYIEVLSDDYVYLNAYNFNKHTGKFRVSGTLKNPSIKDYSAAPEFYWIDQTKIQSARGIYSHRSLTPDKNSLITEDVYNGISGGKKGDYVRGIIKHLGVLGRDNLMPANKKHEIFIEYPTSAPASSLMVPIDPDALKNFKILAQEAFERDSNLPLTPFDRHVSNQHSVRLRPGDLLYYKSERSKVTKLSFSAIWRDFCGDIKQNNDAHGYFKLVDKNGLLLPPFMAGQNITNPMELKLPVPPVSALMGFVKEKAGESEDSTLALAGRVFFSHGILSPDSDKTKIRNGEKTLKILDSPKPPCPEFYFYQKNRPSSFVTKNKLKPNGNYLPNGRKFYWHHHDAKPYAPDEKYIKEHINQLSRIEPISVRTKFLFSIDFFNLTEFELGMLLYGLKPSDDFRHLIGMGKPLGLGRINIEVLNLLFVDRKKRYQDDALFSMDYFHDQTDTEDKRISEISNQFSRNQTSFYQKRFCSTISKKSEKNIQLLQADFISKVKKLYGEDWLIPLEKMGNPATTKDTSVQYPNFKQGGCDESFKWWVRNADKEKDVNGKKETLFSNLKEKDAPTIPFNPRQ